MTPLLLALPLLLAAPVPKDFKKAVPKLDGEWLCVSEDFSGRPQRQNAGRVWRFDGDSLFVESDSGQPEPIPIRTDPKTSPAAFQFVENKDEFSIYEIRGDTLTICVSARRGVSPTDFGNGPDILRYSFTRAKGK